MHSYCFLIITFIAAVAAFAFGGFWYSPKILGNAWMKLTGITGASKSDMRKRMLITFICHFVMALTLFMIDVWAHATTARAGLAVGMWVGLGIAGGGLLVPYIWEGRPAKLFAIVAGGTVFSIMLMSAIIAQLIGQFFYG